MAGSIGKFGNITISNLILHLDAGKKVSYDRSGGTWTDLSPNQNDGTLNSFSSQVIWTNPFTNASGGAITFNGTNNWVSVNHKSELVFSTSNFSINVWFMISSLKGYQAIICKPGNSDYNGWLLYLETNNIIYFVSGDGVGGAWKAVLNDSFVPSVNTWYNYTITRSGNNWTVYRNGNSVSTSTTAVTISDAGNPLNIGRYLNFPGGAKYLSGSISLIQIYNRSLSSSEITQLYTNQKNRFSSTTLSLIVEYLVVAGGGGGGAGTGGGGGAGGLLAGSFTLASSINYTLTIGAGGSGGVGRSSMPSNGSNTTVFGLTSFGGGYGAADACSGLLYNANTGGSGGGGSSWCSTYLNANGTTGQGNAGGAASGNVGGGGGGAGGAGIAGSSGTPGAGGAGTQSLITGLSISYSGGGGGCPGASGGTGGGGAGGNVTNGVAGGTNTGGGGGGGYTHLGGVSGNGGSGIIIIAYPDTNPALTIGVGLTYDTPSTRSGYRIYRFTAGAGTIRL